jgi:hypothetical protein
MVNIEQFKVEQLKARIKLLQARDAVMNDGIIRKLMRKIRQLETKK